MLGRLFPVGGLVEQLALDADHGVAADHPIGGASLANAERLRLGEIRGEIVGQQRRRLERGLVDLRRSDLEIDPRRFEHRPADCA